MALLTACLSSLPTRASSAALHQLLPYRLVASHPARLARLSLASGSIQTSEPNETFADLGCAAELVHSLRRNHIELPTEVQALSYKPLLDTHQDAAVVAEAGSGKTLAYLVPLISQLLRAEEESDGSPDAESLDDLSDDELTNTQRRIRKLQANLEKEATTRQERTQQAQQQQMLEELLSREAHRQEMEQQRAQQRRRLHVLVPNVELEAQVLSTAFLCLCSA